MQVLDHGYVNLIRVDGSDQEIAETARTSTDTSATEDQNAKLVKRLVRDRHTSPIEFVGMVLEIHMPIFVARQWMRHRTGAFNEFSLRYSEATDVYYVPSTERCQAQSTFNKQGSAEFLGDDAASVIQERIKVASDASYELYKQLLDMGLTRELSRIVLPVNFYTKVRWKIDLHNLMHFMKLREDPHAQWEVRQYAHAIHALCSEHFPVATKAFEDFVQNKIEVSPGLASSLAVALSRLAGLDEDIHLSSEEQEFVRRYCGD